MSTPTKKQERVLVYDQTNKPVKKGDTHTLSYDEKVIVTGWREPHTINSTGRVYVKHEDGGDQREYFPSVIEAHWTGEYAQ